MSVAVLITYREGVASPVPEYLPVATEGVFATYWLPAAAVLGCEWMPLFQTGAPVPLEDFPDVLDEPRRLRDHFAAQGDRLSATGVRERSAWLVGELEKIDPGSIKELWIG
jgi:hypothetical protein